MNIGAVLRKLGGIPRRINDAMYDEDPIMRERTTRIKLGDDLGEADLPTGEIEEVGKGPRRPSRLSQALGDMARGAFVAASNPTPGKIGTAADIFGAMGAVRDDRREQDLLAMQMDRQRRKDAMDERLNNAKARSYEAEADLDQWRSQQTVKGRNRSPSIFEQYQEAYKYLIEQKNPDGSPMYSPEDAHQEAYSIVAKTPHPGRYNLKTPGTTDAERNTQFRKWSSSPELQSQYPTFPQYWDSLGIGQSKASDASKKTAAEQEKKAWFNPRFINSKDGTVQAVRVQRDSLSPIALPVLTDTNKPLEFPVRKPAAPKPTRARYRYTTDKDGVEWRENIDDINDRVKTGVIRRVPGKKSDGIDLTQALGGSGSPDDPMNVRNLRKK